MAAELPKSPMKSASAGTVAAQYPSAQVVTKKARVLSSQVLPSAVDKPALSSQVVTKQARVLTSSNASVDKLHVHKVAHHPQYLRSQSASASSSSSQMMPVLNMRARSAFPACPGDAKVPMKLARPPRHSAESVFVGAPRSANLQYLSRSRPAMRVKTVRETSVAASDTASDQTEPPHSTLDLDSVVANSAVEVDSVVETTTEVEMEPCSAAWHEPSADEPCGAKFDTASETYTDPPNSPREVHSVVCTEPEVETEPCSALLDSLVQETGSTTEASPMLAFSHPMSPEEAANYEKLNWDIVPPDTENKNRGWCCICW